MYTNEVSYATFTPPTSYQEDRFYSFWNKRTSNIPLERQFKIGPYYADFAHIESRTVIEIDGAAYHSTHEQIEHDQRRQFYIESHGWYVIRFTGSQVYRDPVRSVYKARLDILSRTPFSATPL